MGDWLENETAVLVAADDVIADDDDVAVVAVGDECLEDEH